MGKSPSSHSQGTASPMGTLPRRGRPGARAPEGTGAPRRAGVDPEGREWRTGRCKLIKMTTRARRGTSRGVVHPGAAPRQGQAVPRGAPATARARLVHEDLPAVPGVARHDVPPARSRPRSRRRVHELPVLIVADVVVPHPRDLLAARLADWVAQIARLPDLLVGPELQATLGLPMDASLGARRYLFGPAEAPAARLVRVAAHHAPRPRGAVRRAGGLEGGHRLAGAHGPRPLRRARTAPGLQIVDERQQRRLRPVCRRQPPSIKVVTEVLVNAAVVQGCSYAPTFHPLRSVIADGCLRNLLGFLLTFVGELRVLAVEVPALGVRHAWAVLAPAGHVMMLVPARLPRLLLLLLLLLGARRPRPVSIAEAPPVLRARPMGAAVLPAGQGLQAVVAREAGGGALAELLIHARAVPAALGGARVGRLQGHEVVVAVARHLAPAEEEHPPPHERRGVALARQPASEAGRPALPTPVVQAEGPDVIEACLLDRGGIAAARDHHRVPVSRGRVRLARRRRRAHGLQLRPDPRLGVEDVGVVGRAGARGVPAEEHQPPPHRRQGVPLHGRGHRPRGHHQLPRRRERRRAAARRVPECTQRPQLVEKKATSVVAPEDIHAAARACRRRMVGARRGRGALRHHGLPGAGAEVQHVGVGEGLLGVGAAEDDDATAHQHSGVSAARQGSAIALQLLSPLNRVGVQDVQVIVALRVLVAPTEDVHLVADVHRGVPLTPCWALAARLDRSPEPCR
mmetsp:Transcript_126169/g.338525  ORF Transcript_126169/g.338525 Transcript_126169/m.338525 type:complete len:742 (-) Transcript_126169:156-2381(-)